MTHEKNIYIAMILFASDIHEHKQGTIYTWFTTELTGINKYNPSPVNIWLGAKFENHNRDFSVNVNRVHIFLSRLAFLVIFSVQDSHEKPLYHYAAVGMSHKVQPTRPII